MKKRILYADLLRIVATFSVIILHTASSRWSNTSINDIEWKIYTLFDSLVRWPVPVFVMLSGMFFLDPEKEISIEKIYKKYIFR